MESPANEFGVSLGQGLEGAKIRVMLPLPRGQELSLDQALNLAAWIVAIADPMSDGRFAEVLAAVRRA